MSEKKQHDIKKEMTVKAEPSVVWRTLTTKTGLEKFFAQKAEVDLKEGGKATIHISDSFSYDVHFNKVIPLETLKWTEPWDDPVTVEWTLTSDDEEKETKITMVSSGFGDINEGVDWGWSTVMRCLKWAVEENYNRQSQPYLGLRGGLIGMGFKIYDVVSNGPADKAGLKTGDKIQGINDDTLCGIAWLADVLHKYPAEEPMTLRVVRKGDWIPEEVQLTPSAQYLEMGEFDEV